MWFKEKKKVIVLILLVSLLALYWAFTFLKKGSNGTEVVKAPVKKSVAAPAMVSAIRVDIDLLKKNVESYNTSKNIFAPVYKKPVLEKSKPKSTKPGGTAITVTPLPPLPPPPPPKSQEEIDAENAREEMQKVKVLGFLKRKQRTDVFLSLGNSNYIVGKGDVITKGYYLEDVAKDFVMISDRKTGIQVKVPADFSGKNAKSLTLPVAGKAGTPSPAIQQPSQGTGGGVPGQGRAPGQRTPERTTGTYGGSGYVGGSTTVPLGGYSIK